MINLLLKTFVVLVVNFFVYAYVSAEVPILSPASRAATEGADKFASALTDAAGPLKSDCTLTLDIWSLGVWVVGVTFGSGEVTCTNSEETITHELKVGGFSQTVGVIYTPEDEPMVVEFNGVALVPESAIRHILTVSGTLEIGGAIGSIGGKIGAGGAFSLGAIAIDSVIVQSQLHGLGATFGLSVIAITDLSDNKVYTNGEVKSADEEVEDEIE